MNTLNQRFTQKLQQLEQVLTLCDDLFADSQEWQNLKDDDRLRFAYALLIAHKYPIS